MNLSGRFKFKFWNKPLNIATNRNCSLDKRTPRKALTTLVCPRSPSWLTTHLPNALSYQSPPSWCHTKTHRKLWSVTDLRTILASGRLSTRCFKLCQTSMRQRATVVSLLLRLSGIAHTKTWSERILLSDDYKWLSRSSESESAMSIVKIEPITQMSDASWLRKHVIDR